MTAAASISVPGARRGSGSGLFAGLACLGDILLIQGWVQGRVSMLGVLVLHGAMILMLVGIARLVGRGWSPVLLMQAAVLTLFGPLGGPALMVIMPGGSSGRDRLSDNLARPGMPPPGAAEILFEQIRQDRRPPISGGRTDSFLTVFRGSDIARQQEVIAAISRGYRPQMRDALSAALASEVPALRVQAAAVHARLRADYGAQARALLKGGNTGTDPDRAARCLGVAQSGFIDAGTADALRRLAEALSPMAAPPAARDDGVTQSALPPGLQPVPALRRYSCGGLG